MKNYFIGRDCVMPFNKVLAVKKLEESMVFIGLNGNYDDCSLDQYDDYIAWLDLQLQKDIAIAQPYEICKAETEIEFDKEHIKSILEEK